MASGRNLLNHSDRREAGGTSFINAVADFLMILAGTLAGVVSAFTVHLELWLAEILQLTRRD